MGSRGGRAATLLLGCALTIAACAPVDGPAARPPDREPVQVDGSLGVVRVQPGSLVEVRLVLDGDEDPERLAPILEAAFRTAVEDFGVVQQGFRVHLGDVLTTACDRASGELVGRSLADDAGGSGVVAVLGPQCTDTLLGLQGPASTAGLTIITPRPQTSTLTVAPDGVIGQDRAAGMWRTAPSALAEVRAAARYATDDLELGRAVTLHDGSIESAALAEAFRLRFEALGGTVVLARQVDPALTGDDQDASAAALDALLDAIAASEPDIVVLVVGGDGLLAVSDGLAGRSRLARVPRLTTSAHATADVLGDDASTGLLVAGPAFAFDDVVSAVTGMSASQTLERVSAGSGVASPLGWWAYAYDAATLLLKAMEDASLVDVDGSFVLSRAELRETVARTGFGGLTGPVRCSAEGDCAAPRIAIRERGIEAAGAFSDLPVVAQIGD